MRINSHRMIASSLFIDCFFFFLGFLSRDIHDSLDSRRKDRPFLILLYHFHPLHEHLQINQAIATGTCPWLMAGLEPGTFTFGEQRANH